jgi:hypothetical protein
MSDSDKLSYAPFILLTGEYPSLILSDNDMLLRVSVFEEREDEGWMGNGYDWTSIAQVVLNEKLPDLLEKLEFDPEAGMFSASGSIDSLKRLGKEMKLIFDDENMLRDFLSRAELD